MGISVCIIVKNNQETISRCLESVKDYVDEIIVVDTGSTDNTVKIAEQFTRKIYYFEWKDNFSDAKNFALSKASEDWILALDADETVSRNDMAEIRRLVSNEKEFLALALIQRSYTNTIGSFDFVSGKDDEYEESKIAAGFSPARMIRVFRNDQRIKFEGAVHDSVERSVLRLGKIRETEIPIHHYGLLNRSSDRTKYYIDVEKKNLRNDFFQDFQIGVQLNNIGNLDEAIQWLNKSIEKNPGFSFSWLELGIVMIKNDNLDEAKIALEKAESLEKHPMTYNYLGILYGKFGEFEKSVDYLKRAIILFPKNADFHFNLGLTYHQLEMKKEAYFEFREAVSLNPEYKKIVQVD